MERGTQTMFAAALGAVLLLIGLVGLFDDNLLLGLFGVNGLHNAVHLVSGAIGLWAGLWGGIAAARWYNRVFGIVYALVFVLGILGVGFVVDALNLNTPDNWLHFLIAVPSLVIGFSRWE